MKITELKYWKILLQKTWERTELIDETATKKAINDTLSKLSFKIPFNTSKEVSLRLNLLQIRKRSKKYIKESFF